MKASAAQKAVRLVAAMILKDVSDGYNLGQVGAMVCVQLLVLLVAASSITADSVMFGRGFSHLPRGDLSSEH